MRSHGTGAFEVEGREAIEAIRKPLFVLLLLNGALTVLLVIAAIIRPDWQAMTGTVTAWLR